MPYSIGALARSCKVIKEAVKDAKDKLKVEYDAARALVLKCGETVEQLVEERPTELYWYNKGLTAADAPVLTNVLKSKAMAQVGSLTWAAITSATRARCRRGCGCGRRPAASSRS